MGVMAPAMTASAGQCVAVVIFLYMNMLGCTMGSALGNQPVLESFRPQRLQELSTCDQRKACSHLLMSALTTDLIMPSELSYLKLVHCVDQGMGIKGFHSTNENPNETDAWISYEGMNYLSVYVCYISINNGILLRATYSISNNNTKSQHAQGGCTWISMLGLCNFKLIVSRWYI